MKFASTVLYHLAGWAFLSFGAAIFVACPPQVKDLARVPCGNYLSAVITVAPYTLLPVLLVALIGAASWLSCKADEKAR